MKTEKNGWGIVGEYANAFQSYVSADHKEFLIGAGEECDAALLAACPAYQFGNIDFWQKYFQLDQKGRVLVREVMDAMSDSIYLHQGMIWEAVANFLYRVRGVELYPEAADFSVCLKGKDNLQDVQKSCYDRMHNAFKRQKITGETEELLRCFCAYHLVTPEILRTGHGSIYCLREQPSDKMKERLSLYTVKAVHRELTKTPDAPLDEIICRITGISSSDLDEYKLRVAFEGYGADKKTVSFLNVLMDTWIKSFQ